MEEPEDSAYTWRGTAELLALVFLLGAILIGILIGAGALVEHFQGGEDLTPERTEQILREMNESPWGAAPPAGQLKD